MIWGRGGEKEVHLRGFYTERNRSSLSEKDASDLRPTKLGQTGEKTFVWIAANSRTRVGRNCLLADLTLTASLENLAFRTTTQQQQQQQLLQLQL